METAMAISVYGQNRNEFQKEADRWSAYARSLGHECIQYAIHADKCNAPEVPMAQVDTLAIFCHGYHSRLQIGMGLRDIANRVKHGGTISLYCCKTARSHNAEGPQWTNDLHTIGTIAEALSLMATDCTVYAHTTSGHTARNPYKVMLRDGVASWVIEPGTRAWPVWVKWLKAMRTTNRFKLSFHPEREVIKEIVVLTRAIGGKK